jgi:hypothetical protein
VITELDYLALDGEGTKYGRSQNGFLFLNADSVCSTGGKFFGKGMNVGIGTGDGFAYKDELSRGRGDGYADQKMLRKTKRNKE